VPLAVPTPALRPAVSVVPIPTPAALINLSPTTTLEVAVITPALTLPVKLPVTFPVTLPVTLPVKFLVIVAGSLSLLIVPVVMLAPSARLVAVVAVPLKAPLKLVAVTIPRPFTLLLESDATIFVPLVGSSSVLFAAFSPAEIST
jgi:hypothetical protein